MRCVVSLWLPSLPTDRLARAEPRWRSEPLATVLSLRGRLCLAAVNEPARDAELVPGQPLANARALLPSLHVAPAHPETDAALLADLADWCGRYSPWTSVETPADTPLDATRHGIWIDVTGCAHLFGGEAALLADLRRRLEGMGYAARAAIAETPGAAWAVARHGDAAPNPPPSGGIETALAALPLAGLRLDTTALDGLARLGLRRIGELEALPRAGLARRFGATTVTRLDQAFGRAPESIAPRRPMPPHRTRLAFPDPIARPEDIAHALRRLLDALCARLAAQRRGARRLTLVLYPSDGAPRRTAIGTSRPLADPDHLMRLFAEKLEPILDGNGVDAMALDAPLTEATAPRQASLPHPRRPHAHRDKISPTPDPELLGQLMDRLGNRLGTDKLVCLMPRDSHWPERAQIAAAPLVARAGVKRTKNKAAGAVWPAVAARPLRLLSPPEPIEAMAPLPDRPPLLFRWRKRLHRVARAEGPERLAPEWWRAPDTAPPAMRATRDYYRLEDSEGRRFWVFRAGLYDRTGLYDHAMAETAAQMETARAGSNLSNGNSPDMGPLGLDAPRWFLHGFFA
ncbi:MAG: Y-family DNA polymerase [Alphaproteobacteria bacterium]